MPDRLAFLTPDQVEAAREQFRHIYREAFAQPPYSRGEAVADNFANSLLRHIQREGFRCAVALADGPAEIVGFAFGYTTGPGQWWHDLIAMALGEERSAQWLAGGFELVELAVAPQAQGRRLGSQLHDHLLSGLPHRTALLSTMQAETTALRLYRRRGWITLLENFIFPGGSKPYLIMGLDLASRPPPPVDRPA